MSTIRDVGVEVVEALSTDEALSLLQVTQHPFGAVVSDMIRKENGAWHPEAGIELIREVRSLDQSVPIFIYASPEAVRARADEARAAGATLVTASPTALLAGLSIAAPS
jgi:hypothetical protein